MFRNKQAVEQPRLYPLFVMITVLKDAFTAVSAVTVGKINSEAIFKYLLYYNVIRDKLNGTSACSTINQKYPRCRSTFYGNSKCYYF